MWKKILLWTLIIAAYAADFITPIAASFYLFGNKLEQTTISYGFLFTVVVAATVLVFYRSLNNTLNKQKTNMFKLTIRLGTTLPIFYVLAYVVKGIDTSAELLIKFFYITMGGLVLGYIIKVFTLFVDKETIQRLEVF